MSSLAHLFILIGIILELAGAFFLLRRNSAGWEAVVLGLLCLLVGFLAR
ncbi:hypothetical protein [Polycladomyces subterraneus]|jgi:hypothetical protein|uniref:Uncharacterized protein n=1 Tax=Polycladomyces subterraneus TaxID=1016997 RepID=A0ABT8IQG9_9BACL|nr:hypothetical protein [Polycladomyces subterraneus]MDN4594359.1 hypothetical protein [Polycladomyces subterraneus]